MKRAVALLLLVLPSIACVSAPTLPLSAEARLGERLFSEPRFAQYFQAHSGRDINRALPAGDPVLAVAPNGLSEQPIQPGPYARQTLSCRACHLSTELQGRRNLPARGANLFNDYARRSPVPVREDGRKTTPRHTQSLVGVLDDLPEGWGLLHWDGEFATIEDLAQGTFTGRNFGWIPTERPQAIRHFARIIREDDGPGMLARGQAGQSYATLLRGTDARIPEELRLSPSSRLDVITASDEEILAACAKLVGAYVRTLQFSRDPQGRYNGSAYDAFLAANRLPQAPNPGETSHQYTRRLHAAVAAMRAPRFINETDGQSGRSFRFGELELRGMRIFFRGTLGYGSAASAGNCAECHVPPHFTDGAFHNTGVTQDDYDAHHGAGAFAQLRISSLAERLAAPDRWLAPTAQHPHGRGVFLSPVAANSPGQTDLGLWNVYGNPDLPVPQAAIEQHLNKSGKLAQDEVLTLTIGRFKTPTLRALDQSAPYLSTGSRNTIEDVLRLYQRMSELAHSGKMRNAPSEFLGMRIDEADIASLAAFLRSLGEGLND